MSPRRTVGGGGGVVTKMSEVAVRVYAEGGSPGGQGRGATGGTGGTGGGG